LRDIVIAMIGGQVKFKLFAGCGALLLNAGVLCAQIASASGVAEREEIYVIRSERISRITPTDYCAQSRTGFASIVFEDRYVFHTVSVNAEIGIVTGVSGAKRASAHACFGKTQDPDVLNFYAEGELGGLRFEGRGKCTTLRRDFPEPGLNAATCFLHLGGLEERYAGGLLTTNTLVARNVTGDKSDPPGYVQPSIATVRLWRRRESELSGLVCTQVSDAGTTEPAL
jgi:hypothetical protein